MSRPEDTLPPDLHYNDTEARKYTTSSRIQNIQATMTHRALELLALPTPSFILDIGCGSGLSGEILSSIPASEGGPHIWVGMDISASMLDVALQRDVEGDLMLADIGQGVPFRAGSFDAAISISAIQWLCNVDSSEVSPAGRLNRFFNGLYASLKRGGRAVCQFYPRNEEQRYMISGAAIKAGFGAGILEDDPGTKNGKVYLVLTVGGEELGDITGVVEGMEDVDVLDARKKHREKGRKIKKGSKEWIIGKKEQMERKGKVVKPNSKIKNTLAYALWSPRDMHMFLLAIPDKVEHQAIQEARFHLPYKTHEPSFLNSSFLQPRTTTKQFLSTKSTTNAIKVHTMAMKIGSGFGSNGTGIKTPGGLGADFRTYSPAQSAAIQEDFALMLAKAVRAAKDIPGHKSVWDTVIKIDVKKYERRANPVKEQPKPVKQQPKPTKKQPKPAKQKSKPAKQQSKPAKQQSKPAKRQQKSVKQQPKPVKQEVKRDERPSWDTYTPMTGEAIAKFMRENRTGKRSGSVSPGHSPVTVEVSQRGVSV
ncbi:hypothetical protein B7494_g2913 [Chlorociboria aeruginascens]|nr:hypothetical protein B7494_g2913 [Chlorociboria aeruginascens]